MKINIYSTLNGVGLERDYLLMRAILEPHGHEIEVSDWNARQGATDGDVAFHLEVPRTSYCPPNLIKKCPINILIPNAEWFSRRWIDHLAQFQEIWCKTQDCHSIFSQYHANCKISGFISDDIYIPDIPKQNIFLHIAGNSLTKGTQVLCDAYRKRPDLTTCFLISVNLFSCSGNLIPCNRIEWDDLRILINSARFIICTSEYEGWGHYLHEALSCKAVVISTNGAPMCEFVTDERCLVPVSGRHPMNLADKSLINSDDLIEKMLSLQQLTESELNEIGEANRNGFLQRSESFRQFLLTYINNLNGKVQ